MNCRKLRGKNRQNSKDSSALKTESTLKSNNTKRKRRGKSDEPYWRKTAIFDTISHLEENYTGKSCLKINMYKYKTNISTALG